MDLVPLPIRSRPSADVDDFICHIQKVHEKVEHNILASNESYKLCVDVRYRFVKFSEGDMVMVRIFPERLPFGCLKNLIRVVWATQNHKEDQC